MKKTNVCHGKFDPILVEKIIRVMKITAFLLMIAFIQVSGATYSQSTKLKLNYQNVKISELLDKIEKNSDYRFFYDSQAVDLSKTVSVNSNDSSLKEILNEVLGSDLYYELVNNNIVVIKSTKPEMGQGDARNSNVQQVIKVSGRVIDNSGTPLPGVTVMLKGSTQGTITNADGNYSLSSIQGTGVLVFSFVGMKTQEISVMGRAKIDVSMEEEAIGIGEVVAIGYGTALKSDMTGSVSSVGSEKFAEQRVTRIDQILQGRASGLLVTSNSGAPGGESKIRIRGANSALGSNDPLYVVDGFVGADYNMVNPNDIAAVEILKDASSTAVYGSRGSNGVIIITTKAGEKGKLNVNYEGGVTVSNVIGTMPILDAADFATVVNERNAALGQNPTFTTDQINAYRQKGGTNWQDEIYRQVIGYEHQLGVSGATDKTSFLLSANYLDQPGIIENSGYKRYTLRSNINTQINDKLSFRLNITGANMMKLNNNIRNGASNPNVQAIVWAPTTPIYDSNGNYTISDPVSSVKANPLALIYDQEHRNEITFGNIIGGLKYEFVKGLSLDMQYAIDFKTSTIKEFSGNYVTNFNPKASINNAQEVVLQNTNTLNFNQTFNEIHKINAVAVFETQEFKGNYSGAISSGLKFPALRYDNLSQAEAFNATSGFTKWTLMSFLGRVNYTLKDKYLLSMSVRHDGSSKFYGDNKFSTFPAVALGWNLAHEDFVRDLDFFSRMKLRASWGRTGSQAIEPYATQSAYTGIIYAFDNNSLTSGIQLGNPGNKNLKWETTEQLDLGLEVGFLEGRLNAELDYFVKNTTDLLLNRPLPDYLGSGVMTSNVGEIQNKGWEFTIGGTIINTRNLVWQSDFNISNLKNEVVSVGGIADKIFTGQNTTGISPLSEFVYQPGKPLGSFWGVKYLGTWKPSEAKEAAKYGNVPGDARYEDIDGDYVIGSSDYQIIGCGLPKMVSGWNNTIKYKDFTLNFFFQGIFGADKFNYSRGMTLFGERDARQVTLKDIKDRYIPGINETSNIPAFSKTSKLLPQSTMFMESGDYIRLKNLSLSYNLPKNIFPKISNVKVSILATNLLTFTKYKGIDPETSSIGSETDLNQGIDYGSYPNAKSFTFSVAVTL